MHVLPSASVVAAAWDGRKGGVVALMASGDIVVDGAVSALGAGYRGGADHNDNSDGSEGESYRGASRPSNRFWVEWRPCGSGAAVRLLCARRRRRRRPFQNSVLLNRAGMGDGVSSWHANFGGGGGGEWPTSPRPPRLLPPLSHIPARRYPAETSETLPSGLPLPPGTRSLPGRNF